MNYLDLNVHSSFFCLNNGQPQGYQTREFMQTHESFIDLTRDSTRKFVRVYFV